LIGEGSPLFHRLYADGLLDGPVATNYMNYGFFGTAFAEGRSREPEAVRDAFWDEVSRLKTEGVSGEAFERAHKKHIGRFIKGFNSVEAIVNAQASHAIIGSDIFETFDGYAGLTADSLTKRLDEFFRPEYSALSVVR
jgi:predicted Zn-dependent peptidase